MDIYRHISQNHDAIHFVVYQPEFAHNVTEKIEQLGISREDCDALSKVSHEKWKNMAENVSADEVFLKYADELSNEGKLPNPTKKDIEYVNNHWKKTIETTLGITLNAENVVIAVFVFLVTILSLFDGAPFLLMAFLAFVEFIMVCITILQEVTSTILWLFIPDQYPINSDQRGGSGGTSFVNKIPDNAQKISQVSIRYVKNQGIRNIKIKWLLTDGQQVDSPWASSQNWGGTTEKNIDFAKDEYLLKLEGKSGGNIDQLTFVTNKRRTESYGGEGGSAFTLRPEIGSIMGFRGRAAGLLDAIGVLSNLDKIYVGNYGGVPFCDHVKHMRRVSRIVIRAGGWIDSIQLTWQTNQGMITRGYRHGGTGGNLDTIELKSDHNIVEISGKVNDKYITQLAFTINVPDIGRVQHGPYGIDSGKDFSITIPDTDEIIGFFGRADKYINGIGVLTKNSN